MPARKRKPENLPQPVMPDADSSLAASVPPPPADPSAGSAGQEFSPRCLCSELVELRWRDAAGVQQMQIANLEEIWHEGAKLEAEESLAEGLMVTLARAADAGPDAALSGELSGVVAACLDSGTGFALEIAFSAGSAWSPDQFTPAHALNPADLERTAMQPSPLPSLPSPEERSSLHPNSTEDSRRESRARAVAEVLEQGSLYRLAAQSSGR